MATDLAQLERALRNADAAGDADAARQIAAAIKSATPKGEAPSGFAMGLADPIHGGAQLLTSVLSKELVGAGNRFNNWLADKGVPVARLPEGGVDQQVREREEAYQSQRQAAGEDGFDWGRLGGNVLNPANLAVARAAPAAATLLGRVALGSTVGGTTSLLAPVTKGDFAEEKAKQAATGAVLGGVVPGVAAGLGRAISPKASTNPDLALLKAEGIRPTVGQSLGGKFNAAEEKLMSVPLLGDSIRNARTRSAEDLQKAVADRALKPIGESLPKGLNAREAVSHVETKLGDAYDKLLPSLTVQADAPFVQQINGLRQMVNTGAIKPEVVRAFNRTLQDEVLGKFQGQNALTGETVKNIQSSLSAKTARLAGSTDADQRLFGDALKELQDSLRGLVTRSNPDKAKELKAIDTGWATFKRMQRAASYVGAEDGAFSASHLQSAVKAMDRSKDKGKFAKGDALLQDLSDAGKSVLGSKVPNSGTADRALMASLPAYFFDPMTAAGMLAGPALYSTGGQWLLRGATSARPKGAQSVAGLLNQTSPMLSPAGGLLGLEMLNQ
jgi:hypothetical protein